MEKTIENKIKMLLTKEKYKEASELLNDYILKDKEDNVAWYLLGIVAMRMKNYDLAHEYFERSLLLKKDCSALLFDGLAYLEMFDTESAKRKFSACLEIEPNHQEANFYLAICYLLEGNPLSSKYIKNAYAIDKKKTLRMLQDFFREVIEKNPFYKSEEKESIRKELEKKK